jgi:hypothetical protein
MHDTLVDSIQTYAKRLAMSREELSSWLSRHEYLGKWKECAIPILKYICRWGDEWDVKRIFERNVISFRDSKAFFYGTFDGRTTNVRILLDHHREFNIESQHNLFHQVWKYGRPEDIEYMIQTAEYKTYPERNTLDVAIDSIHPKTILFALTIPDVRVNDAYCLRHLIIKEPDIIHAICRRGLIDPCDADHALLRLVTRHGNLNDLIYTVRTHQVDPSINNNMLLRIASSRNDDPKTNPVRNS